MTKFKMTRTQFMLLTALNMLGSGILMLPAKVAQVGGIGLLSWFVVCLAAVAMAYAFANCGIYSKYRLGGLGAIAENAFGMPGSFLTNYIYAFSVVIANVAIATTAVGYLLGIFGIQADLGVVQCLTIALLWLSTLVNFAGVKAMGRLSAVTIWGILIPLLFVLCAAPFSFDTQVFAQNWNPRDLPVLSAVTATAPMMFWAFLGLESACANDDSVDNPEKSVPKAVLAATIAVAVIYVVNDFDRRLASGVRTGGFRSAALCHLRKPFWFDGEPHTGSAPLSGLCRVARYVAVHDVPSLHDLLQTRIFPGAV